MINSPALLHAVRELSSWAAHRRTRFRVTGTSMEPTLADGDFVLIDPRAIPSPGDLVLAVHPRDDEVLVVKRLAERLGDGRVVVRSDDPAGSDSRSWGPLDAGALRGCVTLILGRPFAPTAAVGTRSTSATARRPDRRTVLRRLRR